VGMTLTFTASGGCKANDRLLAAQAYRKKTRMANLAEAGNVERG
jgi:hypothetical protein